MTRRFVLALLLSCAALTGCESMKHGMRRGVDTMKDVGTSVKDMVVTPPAASVLMLPTRGRTDRGTIRLAQKKDHVLVSGRLVGVKPGEYRLRVHQRGNCSAPDGASAGPPFEPPVPRPAGLPDTTPFGADLGRLVVEADGVASFAFETAGIALGTEGDSIIGRSLVLTSVGATESGVRVACGIVSLSRAE